MELDNVSLLFLRDLVKNEESSIHEVRNSFISNLTKQLSENVFINIYSPSTCAIQKYCLREKQYKH